MHSMPCVDVWVVDMWDSGSARQKDYPELTDATIRCEVSPSVLPATITYPGGVPTIDVPTTFNGVGTVTVTVFLVSLPSSLEVPYSYRIINADGSYAVAPTNTLLEFVESITATASSAFSDYCGIVVLLYGVTSTYYVTVTKADYPTPPFVMIDLPDHPYFGGIMDIQDALGASSNWTIRISGNFATAPVVHLFRNIEPGTAPSTGIGMTLYDASGNSIMTTTDDLLGFTGEAETPAISNFDVPAAGNYGSSVPSIGNLDQTWTPTAALPTNALVWMQAKQIICVEPCTSGKTTMDRIIREYQSGVCRYSSTDLMLRLHTITSFSRNNSDDIYFGLDIDGGDYVGTYIIADKDRVIP